MSKLKTAVSLLKTPGKMIVPLSGLGLFNWMPDEPYLKLVYCGEMGKKLNLGNPKTYSEKLQWLKLYDRKPFYRTMVDKYEAKKYVADLIGEEYIIPTLGVWNSVEEILFDDLPEQFVLKCTHDSGSIVICKDKKQLDIEKAKISLKRRLNYSTYWFGREWPYKDLKPRIIAEKYIKNENDNELKDYKVHCFHGEPKMILVCQERYSKNGMTEDFYDVEWNHLDVSRGEHPNASERMQKPRELNWLLEISAKLSADIPFLRTDFYLANGQLYFGELTFFPASGFRKFIPESFDEEMGQWLHIP